MHSDSSPSFYIREGYLVSVRLTIISRRVETKFVHFITRLSFVNGVTLCYHLFRSAMLPRLCLVLARCNLLGSISLVIVFKLYCACIAPLNQAVIAVWKRDRVILNAGSFLFIIFSSGYSYTLVLVLLSPIIIRWFPTLHFQFAVTGFGIFQFGSARINLDLRKIKIISNLHDPITVTVLFGLTRLL